MLNRRVLHGCLSLIYRPLPGGPFRFILLPMCIRRERIAPPAMQPVYCRDVAKFVECACAIGRAPIRHGRKCSSRLVDLTDTGLVLCGP